MEEQSENKFPLDYEEKIERQTEVVKKITDSHEKNPTGDSELEYNRELDLLRHYENAAVGNPGERAALIAEMARDFTLNKAVQRVPGD